MRYPAYLEHKQSGVDWLGKIPKHWLSLPLKRKFRIINGSTPQASEPLYWDGEIVWITPSDFKFTINGYIGTSTRKLTREGLDSCGASIVPKNSIIVTTRAPIGGVAQAEVEFCTNQGCKSLALESQDVIERFVSYVLVSSTSQLNALGLGTTFLELSTNHLSSYPFPLPPATEQQQIADFLDWKTGQIDALIAKKKELMEKLKEKRIAVITQAVTKGLDPTATMRDSGIEWLGCVPEHWQIMPMRRFLSSIEQGWSPECSNIAAPIDEWGVVKAGCCNGGYFNPEENKTLPTDLDPPNHLEIRGGDLLMSRASGSEELIGSVALVPMGIREKLLLSDKIYRLVSDEQLVMHTFLAHSLQSPVGRYQIQAAISGAPGLAKNIAQSDVKDIIIPVPPVDEQIKIDRFLVHKMEKVDAMAVGIESAIARLGEYRIALIIAATTGKIDVRNVKLGSAV